MYPCMGVYNCGYHWHNHLCTPVWEFTTVATSDTVVCVPLCGCPQLWHSVTTVYVQAVSYSVKSWNCYARPTVHTSISPIPKQNSKTWFHPYQTKPSNIVLLNNQTMLSYIHFTNTKHDFKTKHSNMTSPISKQNIQTWLHQYQNKTFKHDFTNTETKISNIVSFNNQTQCSSSLSISN